jgi:FkbM family methyltransferase
MFKKILNKTINKFGYQILQTKIYEHYIKLPHFIFLWNKLSEKKRMYISPYLSHSKSQYAQDLFVLSELSERDLPKYFVEFGATNGINWSNSFVLEKFFNWTGILAEPATIWHDSLKQNRNCIIDTRCVYSVSGEQILFSETQNPNKNFAISSPELSTISKYLNSNDWASRIRKNNSINYLVETVSLMDLLEFHNAPHNIGYLSIDTEGSELEILEHFDFFKYKVEIISVEHNSNPNVRNSLFSLLKSYGYSLVYKDLFGADDIYILK